MVETAHIDKAGRVALPAAALAVLGAGPDAEVDIEITGDGVLIRPARTAPSITDRIAAMALPVSSWEEMEVEIEAGRAT